MLGFAYETDDEASAAIVPEGLTIADSPAVAQLIFTNFHFSTLGAYTEAILGVSCLWEGEPVTYCSNLMVTNEVGLIGGREPYGFPKLFGNVEWVKEHEIISAYAEPSVPGRSRNRRAGTGPGAARRDGGLDLWTILQGLVDGVGGEWNAEALTSTGQIYLSPLPTADPINGNPTRRPHEDHRKVLITVGLSPWHGCGAAGLVPSCVETTYTALGGLKSTARTFVDEFTE